MGLHPGDKSEVRGAGEVSLGPRLAVSRLSRLMDSEGDAGVDGDEARSGGPSAGVGVPSGGSASSGVMVTGLSSTPGAMLGELCTSCWSCWRLNPPRK